MIDLTGVYYVVDNKNIVHNFTHHDQVDFRLIQESDHLEIYKIRLEKLDNNLLDFATEIPH